MPGIRTAKLSLLTALGLTMALWGHVAPAAWAQEDDDDKGQEMVWTRFDQALDVAAEKKCGILIYFPPSGQKLDHANFEKKTVMQMSHDFPFVKIPNDANQPLREAMTVPDQATIVVADWFGNEVKRFSLKRFSESFPWKPITATVKGMRAIKKKFEKKLLKLVQKGEKELQRKKYRSAIKTFLKVMGRRGYDAATRAEEAYERALADGEAIVAEVVESAAANPKKAITKLRQLADDFRDTRVEDAARIALIDLKKKSS